VLSNQVGLALEVDIEEFDIIFKILDSLVVDLSINWVPSKYSFVDCHLVGHGTEIPVNPLVNKSRLLGVSS
jgi:hypothetical protein